MAIKESISRKTFNIFNIILLFIVALSAILPIVHIFAVSLSSPAAATGGLVGLWPVDLNFAAYEFLVSRWTFFRSIGVSLIRVLMGTSLNMVLVVLAAYPMSKSKKEFPARNFYMIFFAITMFIGGGLIPTFMLINNLNMLDTIWALVLPGALNVWWMVMMMNFMRGIPKELEEAARIDGASYWTILLRVVIPVSLPSLATILLFSIIGHWNAWFDGMIYMNDVANHPMATYLATQVMAGGQSRANLTPDQMAALAALSDQTVSAAQLFISILPILLIYPFLQKFFIKGIVVGSVK